jgi:ComF family protein
LDNRKEKPLISTLIDLLYPHRCPVCHGIVSSKGQLVCPGCRGKLSYVTEPVCKKCGKEVDDDKEEYCPGCRKRMPGFRRQIALFNYNEAVKSSMMKFKYNNKREYADFYIEELLRLHGRDLQEMRIQAIVPVPVHSSRRRERGYNQSEVLARRLGRRLKIPVYPHALIRTRKTLPQKGLGSAGRLHNLEKAISWGRCARLPGTVLLIDDIYTTGATMEACARALKKAGVREIYCVSICIGEI